MIKKRITGLVVIMLIVLTNSMLVFAKTDTATLSFKCRTIDVSGNAIASISSGLAGVNTAKTSAVINGNDLFVTTKTHNYVELKLTTYLGTKNFKMHYNEQSGKLTRKGYCMWQATTKVYFNDKKLAAWTVCCA
ncbi:MAG: hypothetical protein IJC76_00840 [Lachnospiraceae bacterium]|nr:hypothetical protein [Lachnospiraceae bacterium]